MSIVVPLSMLIYSNSRVSDVSKRLDDTRDDLGKRMDAFEKRVIERIDNGFEHMAMLLKLHEAEHHNKH